MRYILSETQVKRLIEKIMDEPVAPAPPIIDTDKDGVSDTEELSANDTTPAVTNNTEPTTDLSTGGATSSSGGEGATDAPEDSTAGGDSGGGGGAGTDPWSVSSSDVNTNTKVSKWESGITKSAKGDAVWKDSVSRGPANPVGNTKWSDSTSQPSRGKANQLT